MRHRKLVRHDAVGFDVDHHTSRQWTAVPTIGDVRLTDGRHIFWPPVFHPQSVEMTAIFGSQLGNERGLPDRPEAVNAVQGRKTGVERIDKNEVPASIDCYFVNIDIAGEIRRPGHELRIELLTSELVRGKHVLEAPDLGPSCEEELI
jgi:hypothetical protein